MAEANNSAANLAASSMPMKVENISLPGYGPSTDTGEFNPEKYRVRYLKIDMDELADVTTLELLETKGLRGVEVVVLNKDKFTFMDKYIMVITYLELIPNA